MKVSQAIVKYLESQHITTVFGYPGGAVLPLYDSLKSSNIEHILVRNEQSAVHYASGYSRASSKVGVCIATSGPGATNLITGIATAYMDSIPVVIITGQVHSALIGSDAFQEADITGATHSFTKHSYLVNDPSKICTILKEAFYIASTGRPGPVLIDIPMDILDSKTVYSNEEIDIIGYKPTVTGHKGQIRRTITKLKKSKKPIIYAGGGILTANAKEELSTFAAKHSIPVVNSLMGLGTFDNDSELYYGLVGSHGHSIANNLFRESDLIIAVGVRMSNRAMHYIESLNPDVEIVHIDIDPAEIGKNLLVTIPVVGDAKSILTALIGFEFTIDTSEWISELDTFNRNLVKKEDDPLGLVSPKRLVSKLSDQLNDQSILVADVGQNQFWSARYYKLQKDRKFLTSGGLGTMGYSLPAAIGAKFANKDLQVISTIGDGGIQMCLGELAVMAEHKLGVKLIIFKNNRLGMVRELQDNIYGKGNNFGVNLDFNVDFMKLAEAYNIPCTQISDESEIDSTIARILEDDQPHIVECLVSADYNTL